MIKTNRFSPSFTILRFEAVWKVTVGQRRSHGKTVQRLMKLFRPVLKTHSYEPVGSQSPGHHAKLLRWTMEEVDCEGAWPEW
jgi:hypothetical protein